jgi:hypothetical protein
LTPKKIPLHFYRTKGGSEPVREWLKGLEQQDRNAIGRDLMRAIPLADRNAAVLKPW